jgi:hypothetical protein
MTRKIAFAMAVLACIAPFLFGKPAEASPIPVDRNVIWVEEHVSGSYDAMLRKSVADVDRYTGKTRMLIGWCKPRMKCIEVWQKDLKGSRVGQCEFCTDGSFTDFPKVVITVDPSWRGDYARKHLLTHELGHAFGLRHNPQMTSVMYKWMMVNNKFAPYKFTNSELAHLKGV